MRWNHDAITRATNLQRRTSEQHMEQGTSRSKRGQEDLGKIQSQFCQYEPFHHNQPKLCSLSSGLTASEGDGVTVIRKNRLGRKYTSN